MSTDAWWSETCTTDVSHFCSHRNSPNTYSYHEGHPRCICGPDSTGEAPDFNPDCPVCGAR